MRTTLVALVLLAAAPVHAADEYALDTAHASVTFKVQHIGISWVHGRFNEFSGSFVIDRDDPGKCSFTLTIKAESIDTANSMRDNHLRGPDFFNVKQFPAIEFKSTSVKGIDGGYEVTGDLTLHGETRPITFSLKGGKTAEFPKGVQRIGFTTDLTLKRSDFKMDRLLNAVGDEVPISISFEGIKK